MYKEFYDLKDYPFNLTPDPSFMVFTPQYNELLARLYYGVEMAKGLIVLTGEVGTGKTTALRWILRRFDSTVMAAYIFNPSLSIDEFYYQLSQMLGITEWSNKASLLMQMGTLFESRHKRGLRTVLVIDEAHELSDELLEEIRLLMNFESDKAKHLQIILTGQPELVEKLGQQSFRQIRQRIALNCRMQVLSTVEEVESYIIERLIIAGSSEPNIFTNSAIDLIFQCSEGIPRQINNICDNAMLTAYEMGVKTINRDIIEDVADNLFLLPNKKALLLSDEAFEEIESARVLTAGARNELVKNQKSKPETSAIREVQVNTAASGDYGNQ